MAQAPLGSGIAYSTTEMLKFESEVLPLALAVILVKCSNLTWAPP